MYFFREVTTMREEFVSDLKEGMVTAKSVFTPDGLLIVPDGVTLTAPIIRHLDALNVFSWVSSSRTIRDWDDLVQILCNIVLLIP